MYERFYGLRERPFDLTPDPRFLFLSPQHHEALIHLKYGLSGRPGITLLVGDAGTGKSTLVRATVQSTDTSRSLVATMSNPTLSRSEFYDHLARAFGFTRQAAASKTEFLAELQQAIDECGRAGGVVALIVDEAQSLPAELLEELRLLTNVEAGDSRSLALMLVGQPELAERLNDVSLRQLKQRVSLRAHLEPFSLKETAGYIATRITTAGGRADLVFTRDAVLAIHAASRGLPRIISVLCDNALVTGFAAGIRPVGSSIVADVCADFDLPKVPIARDDVQPANVVAAVEPIEPLAAPSEPVAPAIEPVQEAAEPRAAAAAEAAHGQLFGMYQQPKRLPFFRGSRR